VYPSNLDYANAFTGLLDHMKRCGYKEDKNACDNIRHTIDLPDSRSLETRDYVELLEILSRSPKPQQISAHSHWDTGKSGDLGCIISVNQREIRVVVESTDLNLLAGTHDSVRQIFQASNPPQEKSSTHQRFEVKKSVFLAHRFDEEGKTAADVLIRFLRRLGFDVVEGEGYEAREIPVKVSDRITSQDIFICIATKGDHGWILSETSYAKALNKYIVLLCEDGVNFNKGILGQDYEYIAYPRGYLEKAFSDLLYALPV
jgi:hypothetical protein